MGTVRLWNLLHQNRDQGRGLSGRSHRRGGLWLELHLWSRKHRWARMDLLLVYGGTAIRKVLEWSNRKSTVWLPRKCPGRFLSDQRCLRRMRKGVGGKPRACAIRRRARELCEPISPRTPCPPENKKYPFRFNAIASNPASQTWFGTRNRRKMKGERHLQRLQLTEQMSRTSRTREPPRPITQGTQFQISSKEKKGEKSRKTEKTEKTGALIYLHLPWKPVVNCHNSHGSDPKARHHSRNKVR